MRQCFYLFLTIALCSCAVGPDFKPSEPPAGTHYSNIHPGHGAPTAAEQPTPTPTPTIRATIPAQWWQLFKSRTLNQLVRRGLAHNPTLTAAKASLEASRETLRANTGVLLSPALDASLNSTRQKRTGASFGFAGSDSL